MIFWQRYFDMFLFESSSVLFLKIFLLFWLLRFCNENKTIKIDVFELLFDDLNIKYRKFVSHRSFDKLRKLFQISWCFWFVITVMNNRKFETIDVCRENREQNQMIEIACCMLWISRCIEIACSENSAWNF